MSDEARDRDGFRHPPDDEEPEPFVVGVGGNDAPESSVEQGSGSDPSRIDIADVDEDFDLAALEAAVAELGIEDDEDEPAPSPDRAVEDEPGLFTRHPRPTEPPTAPEPEPADADEPELFRQATRPVETQDAEEPEPFRSSVPPTADAEEPEPFRPPTEPMPPRHVARDEPESVQTEPVRAEPVRAEPVEDEVSDEPEPFQWSSESEAGPTELEDDTLVEPVSPEPPAAAQEPDAAESIAALWDLAATPSVAPDGTQDEEVATEGAADESGPAPAEQSPGVERPVGEADAEDEPDDEHTAPDPSDLDLSNFTAKGGSGTAGRRGKRRRGLFGR